MGRHHRRGQCAKRRFAADLSAMQRAIVGAGKLRVEDVAQQVTAMRTALDGLMAGLPGLACWRSMADTANVAESLAELGIGSGDEAKRVVADAQESLAYMAQEYQRRGTWALFADEREEVRERLTWLVGLHTTQLSHVSYSEFERAYQTTARRVAQARAGNAGRGVVVVEGEIAG